MQMERHSTILLWLFLLCLCVSAIIIMGGATRLTHAGLSIVEWKPITGIIPPLTQQDWMVEFGKYQQFPEFKNTHGWMSLKDFKFIYLMEYFHRLIARVAGIVFFIPLIFLWRQLGRETKSRMSVCFLLGLVQASVGWYMVKSGLQGKGVVSHFRLTFHLLMGFGLYSLLCGCLVDYLLPKRRLAHLEKVPVSLKIFTALLVVTLIYGGFVAGLKAGWLYPTFPLMGNAIIPGDAWSETPWYNNFLMNPVMVQAIHRILGYSLFITAAGTWFHHYRNGPNRLTFCLTLLCLSLTIQIGIGAYMVITHMSTVFAVLHQANFIIILSLTLISRRISRLR